MEVMNQINTSLPLARWTASPFCCLRPWDGLQHVTFNSVEGGFDGGTGLGWVPGNLESEGSPECGEATSLAIDELFVERIVFRDDCDNCFPAYVVVEFGEECAPWRLIGERGGSCNHW